MYSCYFYTDSWIEISSQPSSSSLSSAGDPETLMTGFDVQQNADLHRHRRRRVTIATAGRRHLHRPTSAAGSSQDEYEESESETDKVLSSSNEELELKRSFLASPMVHNADEDEDDSLTAVGIDTTNDIFTPQPNAFTHPPSSRDNRIEAELATAPSSYFPVPPANRPNPASTNLASPRTVAPRVVHSSRPTFSETRSRVAPSHSPYNFIAPSHSYQPDHDAALRASLSTLLSCAAAVRGSPKQSDRSAQQHSNREGLSSAQPMSFRLVPEFQLRSRAEESTPGPSSAARNVRPTISTSSGSLPTSPKHMVTAKRKAREQSKDRHAKKSRSAAKSGLGLDETTISPTLMSWMISAGVVLVFSAITFSAGYAWGKEVGRLEGMAGMGTDGVSCGQEAMRSSPGLRRLRWSAVSTSATA